MKKILFINNQDSFVYILVDYFAELGCEVTVEENTFSLKLLEKENFSGIVISPGPGHPKHDTGNIIPMIKKYGQKTPILGVCLGFQAIVEAFGGTVSRAKVGPVHGKISKITHDCQVIYKEIPNPLEATRYHSLEAVEEKLPKTLKITARAEDNTIMGIRHKHHPIEGVQFHPESILTRPTGINIIKNFIKNLKN